MIVWWLLLVAALIGVGVSLCVQWRAIPRRAQKYPEPWGAALHLPTGKYCTVQDRGPDVEMGYIGPFDHQEAADTAAHLLNALDAALTRRGA